MPDMMMAVVTTGNGGLDKLDYKSVPVPVPGPGEVLLRVLAAGVNNTEINTRLGWYSREVTGDTGSTAAAQEGEGVQRADGGWNKTTPFPIIQGTDCCGRVIAAGSDKNQPLIGHRVLVRPCMRPQGYDVLDHLWLASDLDGAFAEYVKVPASEVFVVDCDWSDAELATIPCATGTAENQIHRVNVVSGETVLVVGASGGVGSAAVQLAKRRGAKVVAITSASKGDQVRAIGADLILDRQDDVLRVLGEESIDVVVDNVAGAGFPAMLKVLRRGGRYACAGAIAGPVVDFDIRDMYLKDISLFGSTAWDEPVFSNVISYIEHGEIRPLLAKTFALHDIAEAQTEFLEKKHFGNFVLLPPGVKS